MEIRFLNNCTFLLLLCLNKLPSKYRSLATNYDAYHLKKLKYIIPPNIQKYLSEIKKRNACVQYTYLWWGKNLDPFNLIVYENWQYTKKKKYCSRYQRKRNSWHHGKKQQEERIWLEKVRLEIISLAEASWDLRKRKPNVSWKQEEMVRWVLPRAEGCHSAPQKEMGDPDPMPQCRGAASRNFP